MITFAQGSLNFQVLCGQNGLGVHTPKYIHGYKLNVYADCHSMSNVRKASCLVFTLKMVTNDSDLLCPSVLSQFPLPYPPHAPESNSVYPPPKAGRFPKLQSVSVWSSSAPELILPPFVFPGNPSQRAWKPGWTQGLCLDPGNDLGGVWFLSAAGLVVFTSLLSGTHWDLPAQKPRLCRVGVHTMWQACQLHEPNTLECQ